MKKIISYLVVFAGVLLAVAAAAPTDVFAASVGLSCPGTYAGSSFSCSISASGFTIFGLSGFLSASAGSLSLTPAGGVSNYGSTTGPQLVANSGVSSGGVLATVTVSGLSGQNVTVTISGVTLSDGDASHPGGSASRTVNAPAAPPQQPSQPTQPEPQQPQSTGNTGSSNNKTPVPNTNNKTPEQTEPEEVLGIEEGLEGELSEEKEARTENEVTDDKGAEDLSEKKSVLGVVGDFLWNNAWAILAIVSLGANGVLTYLLFGKTKTGKTAAKKDHGASQGDEKIRD